MSTKLIGKRIPHDYDLALACPKSAYEAKPGWLINYNGPVISCMAQEFPKNSRAFALLALAKSCNGNGDLPLGMWMDWMDPMDEISWSFPRQPGVPNAAALGAQSGIILRTDFETIIMIQCMIQWTPCKKCMLKQNKMGIYTIIHINTYHMNVNLYITQSNTHTHGIDTQIPWYVSELAPHRAGTAPWPQAASP